MGIQHRLAGSKMGDGLVVEIRRSAELSQNRFAAVMMQVCLFIRSVCLSLCAMRFWIKRLRAFGGCLGTERR